MIEYSVKQIGNEYAVLSLGAPILKFPSRAEAESAIAEVGNLLVRPKLLHRMPERTHATA